MTKCTSEEDIKKWMIELEIYKEEEDVDVDRFRESLRDGVLLCQLANRIKPDSVADVRSLCIRHVFHGLSLDKDEQRLNVS